MISYLESWPIVQRIILIVLRVLSSVAMRLAPAEAPDKTVKLPSRDPKRTIKADVYTPKHPIRPSPLLINFHGGGFVLRMAGSDSKFCRKIADSTPYTVIDVDYRLAPEHPFPAALDDAEDVIHWALKNNTEYDSSRIVLSGFSAGGNIALVTSASWTFEHHPVRACVAFYPVCDITRDPAEKTAPDPSLPQLPMFCYRMFESSYLGSDGDPRDPRVSPINYDPDDFPKNLVVFTAAKDFLCMEGDRLAKNIGNTPGHNVLHQRFAQVGHAWDKRPKGDTDIQATDDAYSTVVRVLNDTI